MKVLINTASTFKGGSVQVARSVIYEASRDTQHQYLIAHGHNLKNFIGGLSKTENLRFCLVEKRPSERLRHLQNPGLELTAIEKAFNPDTVFTTSGPAYWRPRAPHLMGFNLGHYIYKDSPFFRKLSLPQKGKWRLRGIAVKHFFKRDADWFVVQTHDANERLRRWLGTPHVFTVSNTISDVFTDPTKYLEEATPRSNDHFKVLVMSAYYPHKNLEILNPLIKLAKQSSLCRRIRFVLTLPDADFARVIQKSNRDFVDNAGPLAPEDCPRIYASCDAVFLPTLLECFSVTYLEAMAMKRPIVTPRLSFAESICGPAALYYEPADPAAALEMLATLKSNTQLRESLVSNGTERLRTFGNPSTRFKCFLQILENLYSSAHSKRRMIF